MSMQPMSYIPGYLKYTWGMKGRICDLHIDDDPELKGVEL